MITLRLDPKLEKSINEVALWLGVSKSDLTQKSVTEYIEKLDKPSPWELGKDLFGKYACDQNSVSADRKAILKMKLHAKR